MVNRHFLRQKVLQSLYAYYSCEEDSIEKHEKFMFSNISGLYDLGIYLLAAVLEARDIEENRIEEAKHKFYPTEEEKNPNLRFINNSFFSRLIEHQELKKAIERLHISFVNDKDIFRQILLRFKQNEHYSEYMEKETVTYEDDRKIVVRLFKNYLIHDENLFAIICERGFTWECDYEYISQVILQFLKTWAEDESPQKILPYPFDKNDTEEYESDRDFIRNLYRNTINHKDEYDPYVNKRLQNWDKDRVAFIDALIINMALTEFIYCPSIPLKVTLNEYIELAKEFSTDKSKLFVNGVLDRVITDLRIDDKIHKTEDEDMLFFENNGETSEYYTNHKFKS